MSVHYADNRCICCGEIIPEGLQVCRVCEEKQSNRKKIYDDIVSAVTDYEHFEHPDKEDGSTYTGIFYRLLIRLQNAFDKSEI